MTRIRLLVTGASARAEVDGILTAGMVGIPVQIICNSTWDGLTKTLVCKGGGRVRSILNVGDSATVAHEVMIARSELYLGLEGRNADGTLVIPTEWACCGRIRLSADVDADPSTNLLPSAQAQLQAMIGDLNALDTGAKESVVAAINELAADPSGTIDAVEVKTIVEKCLAENPPTAAQVGADPAGSAASAVSGHNMSGKAHSDLRLELKALAGRINTVLDSDDVDLDQLSELIAAIKANKSFIDTFTTSKVSVTDIVNDLVTNVANRPLGADQGVVLKG